MFKRKVLEGVIDNESRKIREGMDGSYYQGQVSSMILVNMEMTRIMPGDP
jgi:hypothetical protein